MSPHDRPTPPADAPGTEAPGSGGPAAPEVEPAFAHGPDQRIFRFTYRGEPRPLYDFLLERYRSGRDPAWAHAFYPARVRLDGRPVTRETVVHPGDEVAYRHLRAEEPPAAPLPPPLHADEWLLALDKGDDAPVTPSGVYYFTSLAIQARETHANPELTPLHRLDLETGGPVLFAQRKAYLKRFHRLFQHKAIRKIYRAVVHGRFPPELERIAGLIVPAAGSRIETRLALAPVPADWQRGPKRQLREDVAETRVLAVAHHGDLSEVVLEPVTGKTNQLRVHLAHVGHPIVGDKKYHPDESVFLDWLAHRDFGRLRDRLLLPRQALHCEVVRFEHPFTGEALTIRGDLERWAAKIAPLGFAPLPAFDGWDVGKELKHSEM